MTLKINLASFLIIILKRAVCTKIENLLSDNKVNYIKKDKMRH